ncbi:MAG: hypothetical protein ACLU94_10255 [Catenibacillus sp.]
MNFDNYVDAHLIPMPNNEEIFGHQYIYDSNDRIIGNYKNLLINATDISFDNVYELTASYQGIMIPAHIDKDSTSLLSNLGFIPPDSRFTCAEVKNIERLGGLQKVHPYLNHCRIITNSDAHYLEHIHEAIYDPHLPEAKDIIKALFLQAEVKLARLKIRLLFIISRYKNHTVLFPSLRMLSAPHNHQCFLRV